jgi:hypothetical protein
MLTSFNWRYSMQRRKYKKHKRPGSTGQNHWNWSHGNATKLTRQEQADTNCRLRYLCDMAIHGGFMTQPTKLLGRPPNSPISTINLPVNQSALIFPF